MSCVNKNLAGYKKLAEKWGDSVAEGLVIQNDYKIPTVKQSIEMVRGNKIKQFKDALQYLSNTVSNRVEDLIPHFQRIIQPFNETFYVVKGSPFTIDPSPLAAEEIRGKNISFLEELNKRFGNLFSISKESSGIAAGKQLFSVPNFETEAIAKDYKKSKGINTPDGVKIFRLDVENAKAIADAFQVMKHDPTNPEVNTAYKAMAKETIDQYNAIAESGYVVEIYKGEGEPYKNSVEMIADVKNNKHQFILSTEKEFGSNIITDEQRKENPLLEDSGIRDINGNVLLVNDVFRFVHDFFGHTERGNSFGPLGEENAWDVHSRMYTSLARRAMTSETRGQNSWVNFGPHMRNVDGSIKKPGDIDYLNVRERPFAEQKIGLLPEEISAIRPVPEPTGKEKYAGKEFRDKLGEYAKKASDPKKRTWPNAIQFAENILPKEYAEKYKALYEIASQLEIPIEINDSKVGANALASWGGGSVNLSLRTSLTYIESWDDFVETFNHELIHGILSRNWGNNFNMHNKLAPIFKVIQDNFDNASDDVKSIISYIADTSREYSSVINTEVDDNVSFPIDLEDLPSTPNLEELVTYAFTNKDFADFLSKIPSINPNGEKKSTSIWQDLKNLIKGFFKSFTPPSLLDDISNILDEYFDVEGPLRNYKERRERYNWDRPTQFGMNERNNVVSINQEVLNEIAQKNKAATGRVFDVQQDAFQKVDQDMSYNKQKEFKKAYSVNHIVEFLKSKFNVPFQFINDPTQNFRGRFTNGKIILNEAYILPDTPFHEITHPVIYMMKDVNPGLYNNLITELKNTPEGQEILNDIKEKYPELSEEDQVDEALVEMVGRMSVDAFERNELKDSQKSLFTKVMDFIKSFLTELGIYSPGFKSNMKIADLADLIVDPLYRFDFQKYQNKSLLQKTYDQKATSPENIEKFNKTVDRILQKLKNDAGIPGKTDEEKTRKFFSQKIAEGIEKNRRDLEALNAFTDAALFNMVDLNKKAKAFREIYESKKAKTKGDIKQLSDLLNEIEDHVALYSDTANLIKLMSDVFPDDQSKEYIKDNIDYPLMTERLLVEEYKDWGAEAISEWLYPYMAKSVNKALNGGDIYSVIPEETYQEEANKLAAQGIVDKKIIAEKAAKRYIKDSLLIADKDASFVTSLFSGVLNSKDIISQLTGLAVSDELTKALQLGRKVQHDLAKLLKNKIGFQILTTNKDYKKLYEPYVRKAKVWTYTGLDKNGNKSYKYVEHDAFHEEYFWDDFYNKKREFFEKLGDRPPKTDKVAFDKWNQQKQKWFDDNTILTKDPLGKDVRLPNSTYKNAQFDALRTDTFFQQLYKTYKDANAKIGQAGLKYGIVPQKKLSGVQSIKFKKPNGKEILESLREFVGEQEQVYYSQKIEGGERPNLKPFFTHLLEEGDEVDFNLVDSVAKFTSSSHRYNTMRQIEPHAKILKNFIGSNNVLGIRQRQAFKKTSSGLAALVKGEHEAMPVDAKRLNAQLNSYINDVFYGESMETEVKKIWGADFNVWKTGDTSVNGGPKIQKVSGFENLMKHTGFDNLDYQGFEWMKDRQVGPYTIRMTQKDWNWSVKKSANRLGLLTALNTLVFNPTSAIVNLLRGKMETYVEATGGKYFKLKDALFGDAEYAKAMASGDLFDDFLKGKPSLIGDLAIRYDAIQGELIHVDGKTIEGGLANKLFRRDHLFLLQNGGEHQIQTSLMIAMLNNQKVTLKDGTKLSLYEARKREYKGQIKSSDINWTEDQDRQFRETLKFVNKQLNGNYDKSDKAMLQRKWYGSMLLMYKKHIYNALANRYRSGYVNQESGQWTEGYYKTFFAGVADQIRELITEKKITGASWTPERQYAFKKFMADIVFAAAFITMFKMLDDDDDKDELSDEGALIGRRMVAESGQYSPFLFGSEFMRIVKNPFAATSTLQAYSDAITQTIYDPEEVYERSGSGYKTGQNKALVKWGRAIPLVRTVKNFKEPERLLDFYKANSAKFLKPSSGQVEDDSSDSE